MLCDEDVFAVCAAYWQRFSGERHFLALYLK
jgi:hypothetical protein